MKAWLIFIAICIIIPFLPLSDFFQGMLAGIAVMTFAYIIPNKDEQDDTSTSPTYKEKHQE